MTNALTFDLAISFIGIYLAASNCIHTQSFITALSLKAETGNNPTGYEYTIS